MKYQTKIDYLNRRISIIKELYDNFDHIINVVLIKSRLTVKYSLINGKVLHTQFARMKWEIFNRKRLTKSDTIDHINFDVADNRIQNLQVLSREENASKGPGKINREKISKMNSQRMTGLLSISGENC